VRRPAHRDGGAVLRGLQRSVGACVEGDAARALAGRWKATFTVGGWLPARFCALRRAPGKPPCHPPRERHSQAGNSRLRCPHSPRAARPSTAESAPPAKPLRLHSTIASHSTAYRLLHVAGSRPQLITPLNPAALDAAKACQRARIQHIAGVLMLFAGHRQYSLPVLPVPIRCHSSSLSS